MDARFVRLGKAKRVIEGANKAMDDGRPSLRDSEDGQKSLRQSPRVQGVRGAGVAGGRPSERKRTVLRRPSARAERVIEGETRTALLTEHPRSGSWATLAPLN